MCCVGLTSVRGDIDTFLREVDQLMTYHPLKHDSLIRMIARPFGEAFVAQVSSRRSNWGARHELPPIAKMVRSHVLSHPHLSRSARPSPPLAPPMYPRFNPSFKRPLPTPRLLRPIVIYMHTPLLQPQSLPRRDPRPQRLPSHLPRIGLPCPPMGTPTRFGQPPPVGAACPSGETLPWKGSAHLSTHLAV